MSTIFALQPGHMLLLLPAQISKPHSLLRVKEELMESGSRC